MPAQSSDFVISRVFDASRETLWACVTEPSRMKEWWGPKNCKVVATNMDLRPGGFYHYGMQMPDGATMWGKFVFREIVPPSQLEFINFFSDEQGGKTRHPLVPTWPLELLSVFSFDEEGGKTRFTVRWRPHDASEEERSIFESDAMRVSMQQGWHGTLDQIESYLASIR